MIHGHIDHDEALESACSSRCRLVYIVVSKRKRREVTCDPCNAMQCNAMYCNGEGNKLTG